MANFESCLTRETLRRDAAMLRMKESCTATHAAFQREKDNLKDDFDRLKQELTPRSVVQHRPWASVLGAVAAGLGAGMILKGVFGRSSRANYGPPQRVVVHVEGAKEAKQSAPAASHPWKAILDAAMNGLPALLAFAEQHLHQTGAKSNGNGQAKAGSENSEPVAAMSAKPPVESGPFKTSISRRSAPPPRES